MHSKTLARAGSANRYAYYAHGNLLSHTDDIGQLAEYTYYPNGLVWTAKDANYSAQNLSVTTSTYFPDTGFLQSRLDAAGNSTTFDYTELGWPKSTANALQQTSTQEFSINGNVIKTTDPAGRTTTAVFDEVGNTTSAKDAKGQPSENTNDASNLLTLAKDRAGNIGSRAYNSRSLHVHSNSPPVPISQASGAPVLTNIATYRTYDEVGRPAREKDPNNDYTEHTYDANGNETVTRDRLARLYKKQYDRLNRPVISIDPLGNTSSSTYDEAGRLLTTNSPNGSTSRNEYDGRGRLKKWTDPEGSLWLYTYDGVGNIKDIEDALHGHYLMTYDLRSLRLTEENQDQLHWTYTYDALGRLKTQAEPTGITRTMLYDSAGRLECVRFSNGRENRLDYDANNNVLSVRRIDAGTSLTTRTSFSYDALDRPLTSTDTFSQSVGYGYDAVGHVINVTYPGNRPLTQEFDRLGRLVRQSTSAAWGSHVLNYAWDKEGRLTSQTYPNGMTRTAAYDESGRQTNPTYTDTKATVDPADDTIQIALNYAYDKNGNQTSGREKGLLAYQPPTPHDEVSAYTPGGRLQARTDSASPAGNNNWTYEFKNADNTPSFNLSKATCPSVGSLALTYDEDNRTTSLELTNLTNVKSKIQNRYDALGRRISRTLTTPPAAAVETRYVLNLIGGMERILADTTATGTLTALYLHGPDLAVKIDLTTPANITCYHADASGNIVRLTDQTRASTQQYAYSDYGQTFATTTAAGATDANPYRFVGSQGVMEEGLLPGLTFMRARYYLADAGVFLSVDPVKNIGPGWKPEAYGYAGGNPNRAFDPQGTSFTESITVFGGHADEAKNWITTGFGAAVIYVNPITAFDFVRGFAFGGGEAFVYEQVPNGAIAEDIVSAIETTGDIIDLPKKGVQNFLNTKALDAPYDFGKLFGKYTYGKVREFTDMEAAYFQNIGRKLNSKLNSPSNINVQNAEKQSNITNQRTSTVPITASNVGGNTTAGVGGQYTVGKGQTFNGIAKSLGVDSGVLRQLNPQIKNFDKINPNDKINTPPSSGSGGSAPPKPGSTKPPATKPGGKAK